MSAKASKHIIIIGAGIGGLTTAIALRRLGFLVDVYEQSPHIREVGAGIWIAPNAMKVYAELGLDEIITHAGFPLSRISITDVKRKKISTVDCARVKQRHGFTTISIHRAVLQKLLSEEIPSENIHLNKTCIGYKQTDVEVSAIFNDGTVVNGDVLLFADGIHSAGRKQLLPDNTLRYSGQTCWRFIADIALDNPSHMFEIWSQKKGVRVGYSPINNNQVYVFITEHTAAGQPHNRSSVKSYLSHLCNDFDETVQHIIQLADPEKIIRSDLFDFAPVHRWVDGRMALLGDAAHATTPNLGQGACQAIEDARIIAQVLSGEDNIPEALAKYQNKRIEKAHYITNTSWTFARLTNTTGLSKSIVKFMLRMTPERISEKQMDKVYTL